MHHSALSTISSRRSSARVTAPRWLAITAGLAVAVAALCGDPTGARAATITPDQWTGSRGSATSTSANLGERVITAGTAGRVRHAFTAPNRSDSPEPPVVLGGVAYSAAGGASPRFIASSPRTGAVIWSIALPYEARNFYQYGLAGTGSTVLVPFSGEPAGGVLAVNTSKHSIMWRSFLPKPRTASDGQDPDQAPLTDGTRVYVSGASNMVNAFSVKTGALDWTLPFTHNSDGQLNGLDGFAASGGYLYTSGAQGLVAYKATTGKKVWTSSGASARGVPSVADGRVFVASRVRFSDAVAAFAANGCGRATCHPLWASPVPSDDSAFTEVAGADAKNVFVNYRSAGPTTVTECQARFVGNLARLSATTGKLQWHVAVGEVTQGLIRGGSVIWAFNEFINSRCEEAVRIVGYSTAATHAAPAASIAVASSEYWFPQTLAVASGTLFQAAGQRDLVGYRIPGT